VTRAWLCLLLCGCEGVLPAPDWEQMIRQRKLLPYAASSWFPDGRAMQPPPAGTVPRDRLLGQPALTGSAAPALTGSAANEQHIEKIPIAVDRALLDSGRFGYETYCAACHGLVGDGEFEVSANMELRKPPSLTSDEARTWPAGRVFTIATRGYGLMPAYERELSARERWAVVAYLRALQTSQRTRLAELPAEERAAAERALAKETP
jgi:mono/diheme cytochrome c family protein